jgi:hypothetical protein
MGRKPNPLILEYFVRGPKLNDSSNRYPHTCKQCGENFPKGRIDSLTTHITKKCPAISDSDRMRACLELHGLTNPQYPANHIHQPGDGLEQGQGLVQVPDLPQGWSALETLAEASRQVDLNENNRIQTAQPTESLLNPNPSSPTTTDLNPADRFEVQEQFTLDNPPISFDSRPHNEIQGQFATYRHVPYSSTPNCSLAALPETTPPPADLTPEERLQALLPQTTSPDATNLSVAVAAAARLNSSFLDTDVSSENAPLALPAPPPPAAEHAPDTNLVASIPSSQSSQPWGELMYLANTSSISFLNEHPAPPMPLNRGGVRMDTSDTMFNPRARHARARFSQSRRREVQEVRKIGACIRCRILRKNCGKGSPCDTCRKVLSPRVWKTGCVRTKLHDMLDLYSAGVQVVLSQNRINLLKGQLEPFNNGATVELTHFPEGSLCISAPTLVALLNPSESQAEARGNKEPFPQVIMIDQDADDIPRRVTEYMRSALPLLIEREPSKFARLTLETAQRELEKDEEEVLTKALELWGLVEIIDRERQWSIIEKPGPEDEADRPIEESNGGNEADIYTMVCMQINAAAERRANSVSKDILSLMQRLLQDSKTRIGFRMFLTAIILLNCVEKSTWAFKAWEQDHLRPGWPLEREPSAYTEQGNNLAGLLKMMLSIRKAIPQTEKDENGKLVATDEDETIVQYFDSLDLDCTSYTHPQDAMKKW